MENTRTRNIAIAGTVGYAGLVILALILISFKVPQKAKNPPGGVDIMVPVVTEIETGSMSDQDFGTSKDGAGNINQENSGTNNPTSSNLTSNNSNHSTNSNNVHSNNNSNWNNVWNTSNNSNGQGNTHGDGDQGNPNGTIGGHGNGPCKGCTGSGYTFGEGGATYLAKPSIDNGDEGKAVVKVKIDKTGAVVGVEIKQKGTYGSISDDSWKKIKQAAYETKFPADEAAGNQMRIGYLSYDLHPN
jgi:hypothetical protein